MASAKPAEHKSDKIASLLNRQLGRKSVTTFAPFDATLLTPEQAHSWEHDGFFVLPRLVPEQACRAIDDAVIAQVRRMDQEGTAVDEARIHQGSFTLPEENFAKEVRTPEDRVSKLYNLHRQDLFRQLARRPDLTRILGGLLGPDVDVFNSQYIFKNPGAWGQPWHQDSLYFNFSQFPQVGVWLATSRATPENGCLYVMPGSHREPVHPHLPDSRPDANLGYVEIRDYDFSGEQAMEMEPGDVLVFHSFLMHRSADNTSDGRRTALVYHYGAAGTRQLGLPSPTVDWMAALRRGRSVPVGVQQPWENWRTRMQLGLGVSIAKLARFLKGAESR